MPAVKILVIDNYDSFVYNLVQYLAQIGAEVDVWRNDDARFVDPDFADGFDGILLSPGPGTPEEAGVCVEVVRSQAGRLPIFGVCLGLQASVSRTAVWWVELQSCYTAKPRSSSITELACSPVCRRRSPRPATTR